MLRVVVAEKSDEQVTILSMVEDIVLHDFGVILKVGVLGKGHGLYVLQDLLVRLNSIVQPRG